MNDTSKITPSEGIFFVKEGCLDILYSRKDDPKEINSADVYIGSGEVIKKENCWEVCYKDVPKSARHLILCNFGLLKENIENRVIWKCMI